MSGCGCYFVPFYFQITCCGHKYSEVSPKNIWNQPLFYSKTKLSAFFSIRSIHNSDTKSLIDKPVYIADINHSSNTCLPPLALHLSFTAAANIYCFLSFSLALTHPIRIQLNQLQDISSHKINCLQLNYRTINAISAVSCQSVMLLHCRHWSKPIQRESFPWTLYLHYYHKMVEYLHNYSIVCHKIIMLN